ncbi:pyrroloquinoline quinone biosynthesis peptide chaperone PqqD [Microvirga makkahensis]|uniref:Pyrroloquinoline quinone biosynthesis peptide chaperone PqqD n=1 Tax=Microvirga makkahensis TaxID=1128670 RepID=A0A7X3MSA1_9HYPH|nr:pyrroloquinoline quinone biosynthesis peptide chaperone PqqD [Microvirga makkahensis]
MRGLSAGSIPHLPRGVRLHHDMIRNTHVLLAPERAFDLDTVALEVLMLVDGRRSIREIASDLAARYDADRSVIEADVIDMLNSLVDRRILGALSPGSDQKP